LGRLLRVAMTEDYDAVVDQLRLEGFVKPSIHVDPNELRDYFAPFIEPARTTEFQFSREWMREQFARVGDPRAPGYTLTLKINLPPSYLLIHRVWLGGIGVLSQLGAKAAFRNLLVTWLPGFADPVEPTGESV
jgi:hypothetical protein